ncbi:MAG: polyprenyl synthetase family protein [Deltaproteobacteria bacterium]|nr:polyprenyl synthetase family protein [Deltaproteobacteria bacterium]
MTLSVVNKQENNPDVLHNILIPFQKQISELEGTLLSLLDSEVPFVRSVAEYILKNGGKRLRPVLTVISAKMSGFSGIQAYKMGGCIEFIHTASLLHDDVVDNAKIRRGQTSVNAKWGNHVSVLVGDFFYSRASQLLTEQANLKILKVVTDCITALTEGEVLEIVTNSNHKTTREEYLTIIKNKTALLFSAACEVGGLLGGVSNNFQEALKEYGYHLGMAFQLADDVLDYTSSEEVFGKAMGVDLQEGKLTLPLITALGFASEAEALVIKNALLGKRLEHELFLEVKNIIKKYNGFELTFELARDHINKAKQSLTPFRDSIEKDILLTIADYVVTRNF